MTGPIEQEPIPPQSTGRHTAPDGISAPISDGSGTGLYMSKNSIAYNYDPVHAQTDADPPGETGHAVEPILNTRTQPSTEALAVFATAVSQANIEAATSANIVYAGGNARFLAEMAALSGQPDAEGASLEIVANTVAARGIGRLLAENPAPPSPTNHDLSQFESSRITMLESMQATRNHQQTIADITRRYAGFIDASSDRDDDAAVIELQHIDAEGQVAYIDVYTNGRVRILTAQADGTQSIYTYRPLLNRGVLHRYRVDNPETYDGLPLPGQTSQPTMDFAYRAATDIEEITTFHEAKELVGTTEASMLDALLREAVPVRYRFDDVEAVARRRVTLPIERQTHIAESRVAASEFGPIMDQYFADHFYTPNADSPLLRIPINDAEHGRYFSVEAGTKYSNVEEKSLSYVTLQHARRITTDEALALIDPHNTNDIELPAGDMCIKHKISYEPVGDVLVMTYEEEVVDALQKTYNINDFVSPGPFARAGIQDIRMLRNVLAEVADYHPNNS